jgi:hypothetical protein
LPLRRARRTPINVRCGRTCPTRKRWARQSTADIRGDAPEPRGRRASAVTQTCVERPGEARCHHLRRCHAPTSAAAARMPRGIILSGRSHGKKAEAHRWGNLRNRRCRSNPFPADAWSGTSRTVIRTSSSRSVVTGSQRHSKGTKLRRRRSHTRRCTDIRCLERGGGRRRVHRRHRR